MAVHRRLLFILLLVLLLAGCTSAASGPTMTTPVARAASTYAWRTAFEGVEQAVMWGDPATGPHAVMQRWAAGTRVPMHWHGADTRVFVHSGTLEVQTEAGQTLVLGPGDWGVMPARVRHVTMCRAGADPCVFLAEESGREQTEMVNP